MGFMSKQPCLPASLPYQLPVGLALRSGESPPRVAAVVFTSVTSHAQLGVEHPSVLWGPKPPPLAL